VSRRVVALVTDLMDRSRLQAAADVEVRFVDADGLAAALADLVVDLVVVDLARPGHLDALARRPSGVDVVGFGPHVDADLLASAEAAGCDRVLPRSKFFRLWPDV
jgi:hypothetical protein